MAKTTVRLHPGAAPSLRSLQSRLEAEFGVKATYEDIVGALVWGTPPPQAVGMLVAFTRQTAARADAAAAADDEPGDGSAGR